MRLDAHYIIWFVNAVGLLTLTKEASFDDWNFSFDICTCGVLLYIVLP